MYPDQLKTHRVWVFGGTSGIGLACAQLLAESVSEVVIAGRSAQRLQTALDQLPSNVKGAALDVGDTPSLEKAIEHYGHIDHAVVSIGGGSALGPYRQLTEKALRDTFENKFWQVQRCTMSVLPNMKAGSITWITGAAARAAIPGMSSLAASNGAMHAMVGTLARELAPVRINAVSPGFIDTPYWERAMDAATRERTYESMAQIVPVKRVGQASEIAQAVLLCLSNGFMTGAVIDCDGGRRLV